MSPLADLVGPGAPRWENEGRDWPNRAASRFLRAGGLRWHVQVAGRGPGLLLLHGAGAATHSWRGLLPLLAERATVVAPDLPGHGFSGPAPEPGPGLPAMARATAALLEALGVEPAVGVGHSAGAAILARMALDGRSGLRAIVGINPALSPFRGLPGIALPAMARALHWNPLAARAIAVAAIDPNAVPAVLRGTGSRIDAEGARLYARLLRCPGHVAGTLAMMAAWELGPLWEALPRLGLPWLVLAGRRDRAVPPALSAEAAARLPAARFAALDGLGHLAHEEDPGRIARAVSGFTDRLRAPAP